MPWFSTSTIVSNYFFDISSYFELYFHQKNLKNILCYFEKNWKIEKILSGQKIFFQIFEKNPTVNFFIFLYILTYFNFNWKRFHNQKNRFSENLGFWNKTLHIWSVLDQKSMFSILTIFWNFKYFFSLLRYDM